MAAGHILLNEEQAQRQRNRERYPDLAEIVDALRERKMLKSMTLTEKDDGKRT